MNLSNIFWGSIIFPIVGILGLILRVWLVEIKLKDDLAHRSTHLSRFLTYYYFLGLIFGFSNNIFTIIVLDALPTMIAAFLFFDIPFYFRLFKKASFSYLKKNFWHLIERLTLHPPLIITALKLYTSDIISLLTPAMPAVELVSGIFLVFIVFFLLDPRWTKKEDKPEGYIILSGAIIETIIFMGLYIHYFYL